MCEGVSGEEGAEAAGTLSNKHSDTGEKNKVSESEGQSAAMFIKGEMFERLLCCRRKVVEEDEAERGVEQVVLQHTNNNQTEYITSAQLVEVIMAPPLAAVPRGRRNVLLCWRKIILLFCFN